MFDFLKTAVSLTDNKLTLVDIGASGGVQPKWRKYRRHVRPVVFEPNPAEAALLRPALRGFPDAMVIENGLAASAGVFSLNIADWPGCTSLLQADSAILAGYKIAKLYQTVDRVAVECTRFDELHRAGTVPAPDVIKVDVEGYEYEVLTGFGDLLYGVIGIEAEAWLYPVFKEQKLLHDLVTLLTPFGLYLRRIEPVEGFEGDLVCANAYFTRGKACEPKLRGEQRRKYDLLQRVWGLNGG